LNMRASTCLGIVAVSCVSTVKDMPEGSLWLLLSKGI
jgi:hypothetical protein